MVACSYLFHSCDSVAVVTQPGLAKQKAIVVLARVSSICFILATLSQWLCSLACPGMLQSVCLHEFYLFHPCDSVAVVVQPGLPGQLRGI